MELEKGKNYPISLLRIGLAEFVCSEENKIVVATYETEVLEIRVPITEQNFNCLLMLGYDFNLYGSHYIFNCEFDKIVGINF